MRIPKLNMNAKINTPISVETEQTKGIKLADEGVQKLQVSGITDTVSRMSKVSELIIQLHNKIRVMSGTITIDVFTNFNGGGRNYVGGISIDIADDKDKRSESIRVVYPHIYSLLFSSKDGYEGIEIYIFKQD